MLDTQPTEVAGHLDAEPERLHPGQAVDHFRVIRFLDRGAMGEVYLARDVKLGRKVALKLIPLSRLRSPEAVRDFLFEARATARFNHPNIIAIYGVGEHDGNPYVALEYVEGRSVRQRMQQEPPSLMEILRIGLSVAEALQEAHSHGIVHRDLKPENVLIAEDGRIRLLDFGLALPLFDVDTGDLDPIRETVDLPPPTTSEHPETVRGTPAYMAPEQWLSDEITGKTDVWALGMMLVEMINRQHPHAGMSIHERIRASCLPGSPPAITSAEPLPEGLEELITRCLRVDPRRRPEASEITRTLEGMVHRRRRSAVEEPPFPGLLPFSRRHADFFFGRDDEVTAVIERLRETPVLPIVGPSGSGKSSLVGAGVIPRLEDEGRWLTVTVRPGPRPFAVLAAQIEGIRRVSLVRTDDLSEGELERMLYETPERLGVVLHELAEAHARRVLLVVDQLEEIYTQVEEPDERRRFLQAISLASDDPRDPVRVLILLRDDYLGRVAENRIARDLLTRVTVIRPPTEAMLRDVVEKPIAAAGYTFEDPSVIDEMIAEVRGEPAALSLLQITGRQLWDRRDRTRKIIERSAYLAGGGVAGVLAQHADSVLDGLSAANVRIARSLFLRLVTPERTRRVLPMADVVDGLGEDEEVLARLIAARLVSVRKADHEEDAESELAIAHVSLTRSWKRLGRWIDESREDLAFLDEVGQAAELWERRGSREEEVWSAEQLDRALSRVSRSSTEVPMRVLRFLDAGRRRTEREARRRRRRVVLACVVLLFAAVAGFILAASYREQENRARIALQIAEREKKEARVRLAEALRESAASAMMRNQHLEARAKARAALEAEDSIDARALWRRLESDPLMWQRELAGAVDDLDISPDGKTIAVVAQNENVQLFDARTLAVRVLRHRDQVIATSFSPDGSRLASGTWSGNVAVWNVAESRMEELGSHEAKVHAVAFSPGGEVLASASYDGTVRLWSLEERKLALRLEGPRDRLLAVAFSADGRRVAAGSQDGTVWIWSAADGRLLGSVSGHLGRASAVAFERGGDRLVSGGADGTIRIWSSSREELGRLEGHRGEVRDLAFSRGGTHLVSAGDDGVLREWSLETKKIERTIGAHPERISQVALDRSGRWLVSGGMDRAVRLWDAERRGNGGAIEAHESRVLGADFSPDDRLLATGSWDKTVRIWDAGTGRVVSVLSGHRGPVFGVAFSPDGRSVASGSWDKTARIWDLDGGVELHVLVGHQQEVSSTAFSPDGKKLATASWDGTARLWETDSGRLIRKLVHGAPIYDVAVAPDGRTLVTAGADHRVRIFDLATGAATRTLSGHDGPVFGARFSSDGRELVTGSKDGTVRIWSLASGAHRIVARFEGRVFHVDFHPDGAVGAPSSTGEARIIGAKGTRALEGHRESVNFVRFSHDGRLAATTSDDRTVRTFEVATGRSYWRAPLSLPAGGVLTHRGWSDDVEKSAFLTAVEQTARAADAAFGLGAMITIEGRVELWDLASDRRIAADGVVARRRIVVHRSGADYEAEDGTVRRLKKDGASESLGSARIAGRDDEGAILVSGKELSGGGWRRVVEPGVVAAARIPEGLVLGFGDGRIELVDSLATRPLMLEVSPREEVTRIAGGLEGTLAVGFEDGTVGLWSIERGTRLLDARLHGSVVHLAVTGEGMMAASELGDVAELDLEVFRIGYSDLMDRVLERN